VTRRNAHIAMPLAFPGVFSAGECERVRALAEGRMRYMTSQRAPEEGHRNALTCWIEQGSSTAFVMRRLRSFLRKVNAIYRFDVADGFVEPLLLAEYRRGDGFEWHVDASDAETSTRKLSISIQLSPPADYSGGAFEFFPSGELAFSSRQGTALVFPSYLCHRVRRVSRGRRAALVTWAHGPVFR
jgi:PKHD-type hydroxylase